jgi:peptidoglycan/xylan/chitin deacetylase (PgdA/CDA1 family)
MKLRSNGAMAFRLALVIAAGCLLPYLGGPAPTSLRTAPHTASVPQIAPGRRMPQPRAVIRGSSAVRAVALTFDACETKKRTGYDAAIIRILRSTRTPATLFLCGRWMESHPDAARDLGRDPLFELGNHSYLHPHPTRLTDAQIRDEIEQTQAIMFRFTGKCAVLFRPPYGEYDARVLRIAAKLGLTTVTWDVVSGDPDRNVTARRMIAAVTRRVRNGSIVIMHMNGRGWHTAEALPEIIAKLKAKGYALVTVSDLLRPATARGKSVQPRSATPASGR